jgi:membrane protease YdiL (CAAX protease family)
MTTLAPPQLTYARSALLLAGFGVAVALRSTVGGVAVADSATAGLAFAGALLALSVAAGVRVQWSWRSAGLGLAAGVALCLPVVLAGPVGAHRPAGSYASWALVVSAVAVAEEVFLRGVLFDAVMARGGDYAAVLVTAVAFAALHVPLYGVGVLPLDFAVGLLFGALRIVSGSLVAPAGAHVTADLLGWWLR